MFTVQGQLILEMSRVPLVHATDMASQISPAFQNNPILSMCTNNDQVISESGLINRISGTI